MNKQTVTTVLIAVGVVIVLSKISATSGLIGGSRNKYFPGVG